MWFRQHGHAIGWEKDDPDSICGSGSCYGCGSTFIQSPAGAAVAMLRIEQSRASDYGNEATAEPEKSEPTTAEHEENRRILSKYGIFTE